MAANFVGLATNGVQLALQSLIVKPLRGIYTNLGPIQPILIPQATIEEVHHDELEITDHPIEIGSNISDHAFKHPAEIIVKMGFSTSPSSSGNLGNAALSAGAAVNSTIRSVANVIEIGAAIASTVTGANSGDVNLIYKSLLDLQKARVLLSVLAGRRSYNNMLIKGLSVINDAKTENALFITVSFREVFVVKTETLLIEKSKQAQPKATTPPFNQGTKQLQLAPNFKVK